MTRKRQDPNQKSLFEGCTFNFIMGDAPKARALDDGDSEQLSGFEMGLRQLLKQVLEDCGRRADTPLNRAQVAEGMTALLGREISKAHLDEWTAMSKVQRRIHADALKALCEVTGDWRCLHYFVESCGFKALEPDMAVCAEYGAATAVIENLQRGQKRLKGDLENPVVIGRLMKRLTGGGHD